MVWIFPLMTSIALSASSQNMKMLSSFGSITRSKSSIPATDLVYYDVTNYYFEIDEQTDLKKKGVSKEHRPDPIVQMGLFIDAAGIPIFYRLFPGNTNDCQTLLPMLTSMKRDYNIGRVIVVADKGINTAKNVNYNIRSGDGYVYSQTVRGAHKELKDFVFDEASYI